MNSSLVYDEVACIHVLTLELQGKLKGLVYKDQTGNIYSEYIKNLNYPVYEMELECSALGSNFPYSCDPITDDKGNTYHLQIRNLLHVPYAGYPIFKHKIKRHVTEDMVHVNGYSINRVPVRITANISLSDEDCITLRLFRDSMNSVYGIRNDSDSIVGGI